MSQKILTIMLPSEQYAFLKQRAISQQKGVEQLGLEIIRKWLRKQNEIEGNTVSESKDEQTLEAAYREYYAHTEDDLKIIRNMRNTQMRAFQKTHEERNCAISV